MDTVKKLYPFTLSPVTEETSWGQIIYKVADLGFADTAAASGWLEGNKLGELVETYMEQLSGDNVYYYYGRQFPVMVRTMKTEAETPVMVCPDDTIAAERYDSLGKKKFWYIASAAPGAGIYAGFRSDISAAGLYQACIDGSLRDHMIFREVRAGNCLVIPPFTAHCAGAGLEIIEIAEASALDIEICGPSDTTGEGITEALDFIRLEAGMPETPSPEKRPEDGPAERLAAGVEFSVSGINLNSEMEIDTTHAGSFLAYVAVRGKAAIRTADGAESCILDGKSAAVVPAETELFRLIPLEGDTVLLEISTERSVETEESDNQ